MTKNNLHIVSRICIIVSKYTQRTLYDLLDDYKSFLVHSSSDQQSLQRDIPEVQLFEISISRAEFSSLRLETADRQRE